MTPPTRSMSDVRTEAEKILADVIFENFDTYEDIAAKVGAEAVERLSSAGLKVVGEAPTADMCRAATAYAQRQHRINGHAEDDDGWKALAWDIWQGWREMFRAADAAK